MDKNRFSQIIQRNIRENLPNLSYTYIAIFTCIPIIRLNLEPRHYLDQYQR